jgi:hypothetical protein
VIGLPSILVAALAIGLVENAGGAMFFWMGLAMAVACGAGFGRGEWSEGVEEYSLALPPTRRDRYFVRFGLGVAFLIVLQLFGLAAGPTGLIRGMWELLPLELPVYRENAAIWQAFDGPGFYVLSIGVTYAVYAEFYAVCMNTERESDTLWFFRLVPFLLGALVVVAIDTKFLVGSVGYLTGLLGLTYAVPRTFLGAKAFEHKDVVLDVVSPKSYGIGEKGSPALVIALGLTVLLTVGFWFFITRS